MTNKLHGVNLGGWLVLEKWLTPQLFEGSDARDEYELMKTPGSRQKIQLHRQSFITESDFKWLSKNGINAVRIPVGYWLFEPEEPYVGGAKYLDWAVEMCAKYKLQALLCLHGAQGSQNGHDHSGKTGKKLWYSRKNQQKSLATIKLLVKRYGQNKSVWGLQIINEPAMFFRLLRLVKYYRKAYKIIQLYGRRGLVTVFSDAFTPRLLSGTLRPKSDFPVAMDIHWYHFFTPKWIQTRQSYSKYLKKLTKKAKVWQKLQSKQPVIIGEWSGAMGGEALASLSEPERKSLTYQHLRDQQRIFNNFDGWFYWNYKTKDPGIFNFRSMVEQGETGEISDQN